MQHKRSDVHRFQVLAVCFLALVGVIAMGALLVSLARVHVRITATAVPVRVDFDGVFAPGGDTASPGALPGRLVRVDGTATVSRVPGGGGDATEQLPPQRATGTVTLKNERTQEQVLVATTRLRSADGILFRIKEQVRIPARGTREDVAVYADEVGTPGNIGPARFTIPGLSPWLQERVYAESSQAMSGGQGSSSAASFRASVVQQEDITAVKDAATTAAQHDARTRSEAALPPGETFTMLEEAAAVSVTGAVGERRERVQAEVVVTRTGIVAPAAAIRERATAELRAITEARGQTLVRFREDTLTVRRIVEDAASGQVTVAIHAAGDAAPGTTTRSFEPQRLAGFTEAEVETYLKSIPGVEAVEVTFWPFWVSRVPSTIARVEVEVRVAE